MATQEPAFFLTGSGIEVNRLFGRWARLDWKEISRVTIERETRPSALPFPCDLFARQRFNLMLNIYPSDPARKRIRIWSGHLRGNYRRACRFADTLDRALALHREGRL